MHKINLKMGFLLVFIIKAKVVITNFFSLKQFFK